jgi:hypothetical protein
MQKFSSLIFCYLIQYNYGLFITWSEVVFNIRNINSAS